MSIELLTEKLPSYVLIVVFLSYVLWSKFLNKGKLRPPKEQEESQQFQEIDAVIIIFALSCILLIYIWFLSAFSMFIIQINTINLTTQLLAYAFSKNIGFAIILITIVIFLTFVSSTIGKVGEKETLGEAMTFFIFYPLILIGISFLGLFYFAKSYPQYSAVYAIFWLYLILLFVLFIVLDNSDFFKELFKPHIKFLSIIILFGIILGFLPIFISPQFNFKDHPQRYMIDEDFSRYGLAKEEIKRDFYLKKEGKGLKLATLDLKGLKFKENPCIEIEYLNNTKIDKSKPIVKKETIPLTGKKKNLASLGILDYKYDANSKLFIVKLDKSRFKERKVNLSFTGYVEKNISDKFIINYTKLVCNGSVCEQNVTFINKLDYPIINKGRIDLLGSDRELGCSQIRL